MADRKLHHDPQAGRLWGQCPNDADLRWLLEGVLSSRRPELGRIPLLSPVEIFGGAHSRLGRKLSLQFQLTGFPYRSGPIKSLSQSLQRLMAAQRGEPRQSQDAKRALAGWAAANGRQARTLWQRGSWKTVRRNPVFRELVTSDEPVTKVRVAQRVSDYTTLDWHEMEDLAQLWRRRFPEEGFVGLRSLPGPANVFNVPHTITGILQTNSRWGHLDSFPVFISPRMSLDVSCPLSTELGTSF
jgi:hypothetical protein